LRVRLDFLEFTGFAISSDLPDETTLCRFRNKLVQSDAEGFVEHTHTTPANLPETKELERAVAAAKKGVRVRVLADKGFASAANKARLHAQKMKCGLMCKAVRNRPLTACEKRFNKLISKQRFRVEQCFGTLKRRFGFSRSSYFTTAKTEAQMLMKCLCLNLLKGLNKWEFV
jgi:transposase, IS5 family